MENGGTSSMGSNGTIVRESTHSTDFHSTQFIAACSPSIDFFLLGYRNLYRTLQLFEVHFVAQFFFYGTFTLLCMQSAIYFDNHYTNQFWID